MNGRLALADDGIIDPVAVEIAAHGTRAVALTRTERQLAAAVILARGGTAYLIATRLHVSGSTARKLARRPIPPASGYVVTRSADPPEDSGGNK
jgi:DNA-binding NarL/FixJ family response regulator